MFGKIYVLTNTISGTKYVGLTTAPLERRYREHGYHSRYKNLYRTPLYNAIRKYGIDSFSIKEIDSAETLEELNKKEEYWILELNTLVPNGYNLKTGGDAKVITEETRAKLSKAMTGKNNPRYGVPVSEETRAKMRLAKKLRPMSKEAREKLSKERQGKPISEETKAKLSKSLKGRYMSPEHRAKIGLSNKGKKRSEKVRQQMSRTSSILNRGERNPMYGRKHSESAKQKMREAHAKRRANKKKVETPQP